MLIEKKGNQNIQKCHSQTMAFMHLIASQLIESEKIPIILRGKGAIHRQMIGIDSKIEKFLMDHFRRCNSDRKTDRRMINISMHPPPLQCTFEFLPWHIPVEDPRNEIHEKAKG